MTCHRVHSDYLAKTTSFRLTLQELPRNFILKLCVCRADQLYYACQYIHRFSMFLYQNALLLLKSPLLLSRSGCLTWLYRCMWKHTKNLSAYILSTINNCTYMPLFKYDNHDKKSILICTESVICIYCFVLPRIFRVLSKTNIHFMVVNNPSGCCRLRTDPGWIYHIYIWYLILAYAKASIHYANRTLKAKTRRRCDIKI